MYRGRHCPVWEQYLTKLETLKDKFLNRETEIVAVSGDPEAKAVAMVKAATLTFLMAYGLSIEQMKEFGLYISHPQSPEETDRPFSETGMFAVNADGHVQLIDISNTPFNRSDLDELVEMVEWIQGNNYPIIRSGEPMNNVGLDSHRILGMKGVLFYAIREGSQPAVPLYFCMEVSWNRRLVLFYEQGHKFPFKFPDLFFVADQYCRNGNSPRFFRLNVLRNFSQASGS